MTYTAPTVVIVDLTTNDSLVASSRCNGGAWSAGGCS
jgi:hypothetical protein